MRLGRDLCGKPRAFRRCQELSRLGSPEAEPQTLMLSCGKPEAFRKDSGLAASKPVPPVLSFLTVQSHIFDD